LSGLKLFCDYPTDPRYGWDTICETAFGTHPSQVVHEWNSAGHHQENEQDPRKRAFTRAELQAFFDRADDEVDLIRSRGRKRWLPAFRDAVLFKVAYGWGLRRNEARHLQTVDFSRNPQPATRNPHAREFGRFGQLQVRYSKAHAGSAPKRRSVLTVRRWSAEVVEHWITRGLPQFGDGLDLFPTERGTLVSEAALSAWFPGYHDDGGLDDRLDMHSFRRSYVTHLLEGGIDAMFVQHQVGREDVEDRAPRCRPGSARGRSRPSMDGTVRPLVGCAATATSQRGPSGHRDAAARSMITRRPDLWRSRSVARLTILLQ
jgi:integrase/recombinase XerD